MNDAVAWLERDYDRWIVKRFETNNVCVIRVFPPHGERSRVIVQSMIGLKVDDDAICQATYQHRRQ